MNGEPDHSDSSLLAYLRNPTHAAGYMEPGRAIVVLIVNGRAEVHQIDAAIAREAVERHYREREVY